MNTKTKFKNVFSYVWPNLTEEHERLLKIRIVTPEPEDTEDDFDTLFTILCGYGKLELAQFLYKQRKVNINYSQGLALYDAIQKNHINTIKWLISLKDLDLSVADNMMVFKILDIGNSELIDITINDIRVITKALELKQTELLPGNIKNTFLF